MSFLDVVLDSTRQLLSSTRLDKLHLSLEATMAKSSPWLH